MLQVSTDVAAQFSRQFLKKIRVIDRLISSKNNDSEVKNLLRAPIKILFIISFLKYYDTAYKKGRIGIYFLLVIGII